MKYHAFGPGSLLAGLQATPMIALVLLGALIVYALTRSHDVVVVPSESGPAGKGLLVAP